MKPFYGVAMVTTKPLVRCLTKENLQTKLQSKYESALLVETTEQTVGMATVFQVQVNMHS